jgi:hypothetical protein
MGRLGRISLGLYLLDGFLFFLYGKSVFLCFRFGRDGAGHFLLNHYTGFFFISLFFSLACSLAIILGLGLDLSRRRLRLGMAALYALGAVFVNGIVIFLLLHSLLNPFPVMNFGMGG